jgi:hypothetical protein
MFGLRELFCTFDCIVFGLRELCLVILTELYVDLGSFVLLTVLYLYLRSCVW